MRQEAECSPNRDLAHRVLDTIVDESADHETLAGPEFHIRFHAACRQSGNEKSGYGYRVREINCGYFGFDVHLDRAVFRNNRVECQPDAELTKLDGDGASITTALKNGHGELTTDEEAGFFAGSGGQVRFSEYLQNAFRLQRRSTAARLRSGRKANTFKASVSEKAASPPPMLVGRARRTGLL